MKRLLLSLLLCNALFAQNGLETLLEKVQKDKLLQSKENQERVEHFISLKSDQQKLLKKAKKELATLKKRSKKLNNSIDKNEKRLTALESKLEHRVGNLGELFGVVKQSSGDLESNIANTLSYRHFQKEMPLLTKLSHAKQLPKIDELKHFWYILLAEIVQSGKIITYEDSIINAQGHEQKRLITQIGAFGSSVDGAFLAFDSDSQKLVAFATQPDKTLTEIAKNFEKSTSGYQTMLIDPTRGLLLGLEGEKPTIEERIEQGGLIGYVILSLGALGLFIALLRLIYLFIVDIKVKNQRKNLATIKINNPLGRVLFIYQNYHEKEGETLEMKLDEAILKELPVLERGDGFLKLLASVAPLLGLLGTVTGMILTFQAITLFGTGDAKLMAGGISQALMTTVLGLVVAIPLIFLHNIIHTKALSIIHLLEEQSAGMLAQFYAKRDA
jgi:biopolymer transport protein ExbB